MYKVINHYISTSSYQSKAFRPELGSQKYQGPSLTDNQFYNNHGRAGKFPKITLSIHTPLI